jgi:aspartyl-tRNA(Asn)/glutamyl-tRNA(Gln) amidotransferase subunit A
LTGFSTTADLRTITEIAPLIRRGTVSPVDLVRGCLERIEARRGLNAFISVRRDEALAEAESAAREIAAGRYLGPLHGVPVSIKDLIDVRDTLTTSGSAVRSKRATADAPIVARLRSAGAIVIGKTNLHEFAFGTTSDESAFGAVHHPKDPARSAGGSSAGAAVALVEGMCFGSVGTDTGGSIRIPSAACGTVGLKPTLDELPCDGVVPLSAALDHVGPITRSVADAAVMFHAMKGTSAAAAGPDRPASVAIGVPESYFCDRLDKAVRSSFDQARRVLAGKGCQVGAVEIDRAAWTPDVYLHIVLADAAWYHAPTLDTEPQAYSPGVRLRLEMGRYVLAEDYVRAMRLRDILIRSVDRAFERCDVLMLPALAIPAPPLGAASVDVDGKVEPVRAIMLRLTQLFNLSGHPAIAIPYGQTAEGLPTSLQLVGRRHRTEELLAAAASIVSLL